MLNKRAETTRFARTADERQSLRWRRSGRKNVSLLKTTPAKTQQMKSAEISTEALFLKGRNFIEAVFKGFIIFGLVKNIEDYEKIIKFLFAPRH